MAIFVFVSTFIIINLNSSVVFCLSSGDIYLSFGIPVLLSTVSDVFWDGFVILLVILLPNQSPRCFCCFFNWSFCASAADCLAWSSSFLGYISFLSFCLYFYQCFCPYAQQKTKICNILQILDILIKLNSASFFISYTLINN